MSSFPAQEEYIKEKLSAFMAHLCLITFVHQIFLSDIFKLGEDTWNRIKSANVHGELNTKSSPGAIMKKKKSRTAQPGRVRMWSLLMAPKV